MTLIAAEATALFERYKKTSKAFPLKDCGDLYGQRPRSVAPDGRSYEEWIKTKETPNYRVSAEINATSPGFHFLALEEYYTVPIRSPSGKNMSPVVLNKEPTVNTYRATTFYAAQFPACCGVVQASTFQRFHPVMSPILVKIFQNWIWNCGYTYALGILAYQTDWAKTFKESKDSIQKIGSDVSRRTNHVLDLYKIYAVEPNY